MPPISPQGSKGGLVASVVIFTMLFVVSTVLAIYYGVQWTKATEDYVSLQRKSAQIALDTTGSDVESLVKQANLDNSLPEKTALAEAIHQRNELRKIILGAQAGPSSQPSDQATQSELTDTLRAADDALNQASTLLANGGQKTAPDSLVQSIAALVTQDKAIAQELVTARADRDTARAEAAKEQQAAKDAEAKTQGVVTTNTEQLKQQLDAAQDAVKKAQDNLATQQQTFSDEIKKAGQLADASDQERAKLNRLIDQQKGTIDILQKRLDQGRVSVVDPIIRRHQAEIIRVADASTVYINLGKGDQVIPGMTFEVYDKTQPLPKLGNGTSDQDMPVGKGSIEVVRVLDDSTECHVNKLEPGQHFVSGDPILNIVYDRNIKYNFYVYGDFDVAHSGRPTAAQADIIKQLIVSWGGNVNNKLTVDTDFIVMGTAPEVPTFTPEELKDATNQLQLTTAKEAFDRYENVLDEAAKLHIPIMNQNRFLYFTGYYDVATR